MQNNEFLLINNIIYQIYSISDFNSMRAAVLGLLRLLVPNTAASILVADCRGEEKLLCDPVCVPQEFFGAETSYFSLEEKDYTRWMMLSGSCMLVRDTDLMPEEQRIKTELYQKWYAPWGVHYSLQLSIVYEGRFLGVLSLYRSKEEGDFTDNEMFFLKGLSDHLNLRFGRHFASQEEEKFPQQKLSSLSREHQLTRRESEVLARVLQGLDNGQIAQEMCISVLTVKKYLQNLYQKMEVSGRWELFRLK